MSKTAAVLEAGGLLLPKAKVDPASTEQIVARAYHHPALGDRQVICLTPDRLGQAEDLAMEFLGFIAPEVSAPLAVQQRRSLGFAAWALVNDPANARFALDLVKQMKAAARQAKSKPGHAWDAYTAMAAELGRSVRHFLPPFWEEVGRTFKDLGNATYASRALNKSLEAERVHALESDRGRRRDVILEFVLSGCLTSNALSDYGADLQGQYRPKEAFDIFRDLCVRRTNGGMPPWATLPKDFTKLAKAALLNSDRELEKWLEEVIEAPAMSRPPLQFWKTCSGHCKRIVAQNPAFAIALLRHTKPEPRAYGESKLGQWIELLDEWGVLEYLWQDGHKGAPPLDEPIAAWFGRIVRDAVPATERTFQMLEQLAPRLKKENEPLLLSIANRYRSTEIDIDVLEACFALGIKVGDPPQQFEVTFTGWLAATVDHPLRNQDIVRSAKDERFKRAIMNQLDEAIACRGGAKNQGYFQPALEQRAFPVAAGDRPGIKELWRQHTASLIDTLEQSGLTSFEEALHRLELTLWPAALRMFPDLAERLMRVDPGAMLRRTLQAGVFDEYGLPVFEETIERNKIRIQHNVVRDANIHLTFPSIVVSDKIHAIVISGGKVRKHELRLPKKCEIETIVVVGDDLAVHYRDEKYQGHFYWVSDPAQQHESGGYWHFRSAAERMATLLDDESVFLGDKAVRSGDKHMPDSHTYVHDGERFWRTSQEYNPQSGEFHWKISEVNPHTGKPVRESVPAWFEETDGGTIEWNASDLRPAPPGVEKSPLGTKDTLIGWKTVKNPDGSYVGEGIDGRRWNKPLIQSDGTKALPVALLRQPGTNAFLPVTKSDPHGTSYRIWDPSGSTVVAATHVFESDDANVQAIVLPLLFWHFLEVRDEASSKKLRTVSHAECTSLLEAAVKNQTLERAMPHGSGKAPVESNGLFAAVKKLLPEAPGRLAIGIARVIEQAAQESARLNALREKASADSTQESASDRSVLNQKSDIAAIHWALPSFGHVYGHVPQISISEHLVAVAEFLKGAASAGDLPRVDRVWYLLLEDLPLRCWQAYWRMQAAKMNRKDRREVTWLEFLKLWLDLGIADLPGAFHIMEGHPDRANKNAHSPNLAADGAKSFSSKNGEDLFIAIEEASYFANRAPFHFLRYSTSKTPGAPAGFTVKNLRKLKTGYDRAEVEAFIAAVESSTELPLPSREELAETAGKLGASPAEIALVWLGGLNIDGYESNFLPAELRTALGLKTTEASAGRQALRNLNPSVRTQLYEAVVTQGCAAPFAADRTSVLRQMEKAWQAEMPKRLPIDAALQTRLSALGKTSHWQRLDHETVLAAAADPANHRLFKPRELEFKVDSKKNFGGLILAGKNKSDEVDLGASLRSVVQLVALVHAETAAGHPSRVEMPALIKQTTMVLDAPSTLLELRSIQFYGEKRSKPSEWLSTHLGKTKPNAKDGIARFDDGLVTAAAADDRSEALIAYRPAKLKDQGDMARLQGILATDAGEGFIAGDGFTTLVAAIKGSGFQKLGKAILAKNVPEGHWPQNPTYTAAAVVKAIRTKYKLDEDAAVLYAQVLALPDPTTANLRNWNGWTAAQLKTASAELVERKLVLEAARQRAGRSIFLPGEWLELKAPWLPIESWKLAQLVEMEINPGVICPAGGPMVLRPFEDVFADAWKRVLGGDGPRYEEAKRRKKTK